MGLHASPPRPGRWRAPIAPTHRDAGTTPPSPGKQARQRLPAPSHPASRRAASPSSSGRSNARPAHPSPVRGPGIRFKTAIPLGSQRPARPAHPSPVRGPGIRFKTAIPLGLQSPARPAHPSPERGPGIRFKAAIPLGSQSPKRATKPLDTSSPPQVRKRASPPPSPPPPVRRRLRLGDVPDSFDHQRASFCSAAARERPDLRSATALRRRRDEGLPAVSKAQRHGNDRDALADRLVCTLPLYALSALTGWSEERLIADVPMQELFELMRAKAAEGKGWPVKKLRHSLYCIGELFSDLNDKGIVHHGRPEPGDISMHLIEFKRKRQPIMLARARAWQEKQKSLPDHGPYAPRQGKRQPQQGFYCGNSRRLTLKWAQAKLKMDFQMERVTLGGVPPECRRAPAVPAQPITIWLIIMLELYCVHPNAHPVVAHLAAGILLCTFASLRFAQAQDCWISSIRDSEFIEGFVYEDKHATRSVSRPFWAPMRGLVTGTAWFQVWARGIEGIKDCRFIFQAFDSPTRRAQDACLRPDGTPEWLHAPMESAQLLDCVREVLMVACAFHNMPFSLDEALAYGEHSARHTMNECAKATGEPRTARNEIGRWQDSVGQFPVLRPLAHAIRAHCLKVARLADLYAQASVVERVHQILLRQTDAMRSYVASFASPLHVPKFGSWNDLPRNGGIVD